MLGQKAKGSCLWFRPTMGRLYVPHFLLGLLSLLSNPSVNRMKVGSVGRQAIRNTALLTKSCLYLHPSSPPPQFPLVCPRWVVYFLTLSLSAPPNVTHCFLALTCTDIGSLWPGVLRAPPSWVGTERGCLRPGVRLRGDFEISS